MEELIKEYVQFEGQNAKGWQLVKCPCCSDYKVRAGFLFDSNGVGYHCFNCSTKSRYSGNGISNKFQQILELFNIPSDKIAKLKLETLGSKKKTITIQPDVNPIIEIEKPQYFRNIIDDTWSQIAKEYLLQRKITNYNDFLICTDKNNKHWYGRLIIPFYRENKLVFYQGRTLIDDKLRYRNATIGDTVILYNYDELNRHTKDILMIAEGVFDVIHFNGVALMGNNLSDKKISIINQTKRRKIYIPDTIQGKQTALKAISAGWEISTPDIGNCKDINEAIIKYGFLYVQKTIMENIYNGFQAKVAINLYCKS